MQGLSKGVTEANVRKLFAKFGEITSCVVQKNDSEDALANNAFVCFKDPQSAQQALAELNKTKMPNGSFLLVSFHVPKR